MTIALVDADIVIYRCAAVAENDTQEIALGLVDNMMNRILQETDADSFQSYLTGKGNFRTTIYPEYKGNRKDKPKPKWLQQCRDHMVSFWQAEVTDGCEADDKLGIAQTELGTDSTIVSIDKDLLQIPGHHYNFVKLSLQFVTPFEGLRNFYSQVVTGDQADNIPAFDGKFRSTLPLFVKALLEPLQEMTEEQEMYDYCVSLYDDLDIMHRNAKCLWLQRKENDIWTPPC